ncbi:MAG TPA: acyltransferase [Polyangia bacterium]|nr:acyltransferase [Polyangia bacterium]
MSISIHSDLRRPGHAGEARIPSLDGLRAMAILFAVVAHVGRTPGCGWGRYLLRFGEIGNLGVRIFFVISGFLITSLLLAEQQRAGTVSLPGFYLRRVFRIFPAAYTYIAAMLIADAVGAIVLLPGDVLSASLFVANYHAPMSWFVGHVWSLSVEEQFYFFWPLTLVLLGPRRATMVGAAIIVVSPFLRLACVHVPALRSYVHLSFPTVADALLAGCLVALLRPALDESPRYLRWLRSPWFFVVPLAGAAAFVNGLDEARFGVTLGPTILNAAIVLSMERLRRWPQQGPAWLLNRSPVRALGRISYSLYLWQEPFLNPHGGPTWFTRYPLNLVLALAAALLSYNLIEQPFLRLRARLTARGRASTFRRPVVAAREVA